MRARVGARARAGFAEALVRCSMYIINLHLNYISTIIAYKYKLRVNFNIYIYIYMYLCNMYST